MRWDYRNRITQKVHTLIAGEKYVPEQGCSIAIPSPRDATMVFVADDLDQYLSAVRSIEPIPGSNDSVVVRRVSNDDLKAFVKASDRMEARRLIEGWIDGEMIVDGVVRPPLYEERTEMNPDTGKKIGSEAYFDNRYAALVSIGALSQRDLFKLDKPLYTSLSSQVGRRHRGLSSKIPNN